MEYCFCVELDRPFDEVISMVKQELKKEGFGILTEIDVKRTFHEKLNVEFPEYAILGACNPPFALRALQSEKRIGTLLPCNVIVRKTEAGQVEVCAVDPAASMKAVNNDDLGDVARQIRAKLQNVIAGLG